MTGKRNDKKLTDPLEQWLGYRLRRISAAAMGELGPTLAEQNFTPSLASVVMMIDANPGQTQAQIGRALAIKRANIAPMISRLEADGLISKQSLDGRSFGLMITDSGKSITAKLASVFTHHDVDIFGSLTNEERKTIAELMDKIRRAQSRRDSPV